MQMKIQRGFSLVELLIALVLGAFLLFGILQVFSGNQRSNSMQISFARVQESGRVASEMMARDIRLADYWGCLTDPSLVVNRLDITDSDYNADSVGVWLTGNSVNGVDNANNLLIGAMNVVDGTDTLTLKTSSDACTGAGRLKSSNLVNASLFVSQNCQIDVGQVVMVTNCTAGDIFTATSVQQGTGGNSDKRTVVHNTGNNAAAGVIDNATKGLSAAYGPDAKVLVPVLRTYFLSADGPSGTASLYLQENAGAPVEMVAGVEDMQILYGEDTTGDGIADGYFDAGSVTDMDNVTSIRVSLRVAGEEAVTNDGDVLRKIFTSVTTIRNRAL